MLGNRLVSQCTLLLAHSSFQMQLGAEGWSWKSLLPYFKKSESSRPQTPDEYFPGATEVSDDTYYLYHGKEGPIQVSLTYGCHVNFSLTPRVPCQSSFNVIYSNITDPYVEAVNNLGILTNGDPVRLTYCHHIP